MFYIFLLNAIDFILDIDYIYVYLKKKLNAFDE